MDDIVIDVARDFSRTPGPRFRSEGDFSGELFRERLLKPNLELARGSGQKIVVVLDGTAGYATSFLEEAFGGLARLFGSEQVEAHVEVRSEEEPYLVDEVRAYIRRANEERKR